MHFTVDSQDTDMSHGWRGNTADERRNILRSGLPARSYPWYCHAIRGPNSVLSDKVESPERHPPSDLDRIGDFSDSAAPNGEFWLLDLFCSEGPLYVPTHVIQSR
ncbi:MAG TPA: hypothetical protein VGH74_01145, partial [Planctomycetaceae bacterium]